MRDSFIFYRSWFETIDKLPKNQQWQTISAIIDFALNDKEPELSGTGGIIFDVIKPLLEANNKKYKNGCNGGRPADDDSPRKEIENIKLVNLTELQYDRLVEKFSEPVVLKAIELLENWLETANISKSAKAALGKNHYCYFKSDKWIIKDAIKLVEKENAKNQPNWSV